MNSEVLVNGSPSDGRIPLTDSSVLRGDGCFEVIRVYQSRPFAVERHLRRLHRSADMMEIPLPDIDTIAGWVARVSRGSGDCAVRVVATRGSAVHGVEGEPTVIVFAHGFKRAAPSARLLPVEAPWHGNGATWALSGAKSLSYAPNLASSRVAVAQGYDDALLVSRSGEILEGPTFSIAWVADGRLETPRLDLGILASITREIILELAVEAGIAVVEGVWDLQRLESAEEVMALSTLREVQVVRAVGGMSFSAGVITSRLASAFASLLG